MMIRDSLFADTFAKVTSGVYIVTTSFNGKLNGLSAAWVSRVSFDPPMVVVSVGKGRYSHDLISHSKVFAVNIMGADQIETARFFGSISGRDTDKFAKIPYVTKITGSPILTTTIAYLDCNLVHEYPAGDHTLFVGHVAEAGVLRDEPPLAYKRADFK